jgi:hypothetical protein
MSRYKKENFNRIWNKESNKSRDTLKAKVVQRGLKPTEKNCFDLVHGEIDVVTYHILIHSTMELI